MTLLPGDVLLYKPKGLYGWLIRVKTWHPVAHCEVYMGGGQFAASRDKIGVGYYPLRTSELAYVLRPRVPFDAASARQYVQSMLGTPYGWFDLANFMGWKVDAKGIICSPFATYVLRKGSVPVFNNEPAELIAPFQFLDSELLQDVTASVTV